MSRHNKDRRKSKADREKEELVSWFVRKIPSDPSIKEKPNMFQGYGTVVTYNENPVDIWDGVRDDIVFEPPVTLRSSTLDYVDWQVASDGTMPVAEYVNLDQQTRDYLREQYVTPKVDWIREGF